MIYTTPLKALSNQKLFEMRARFGPERAGLQTGDVSVAVDADVVVMTTEVLRNIMFRVGDSDAGARPTRPITLPTHLSRHGGSVAGVAQRCCATSCSAWATPRRARARPLINPFYLTEHKT